MKIEGKVFNKDFWINWGFREETLINNPLYLQELARQAENEFFNRHEQHSSFEKAMELANLVDKQLDLFNKKGEASPVSINPNFFWPLLRTLFKFNQTFGPYIDLDEPGNFPSDTEISKRSISLRDNLKNASRLKMGEKRSMEKVCGYLGNEILEYQKHLRQLKREAKKALEI